jgi:hypothetical protein
VPVINEKIGTLRRMVDFTLVSGFVLREIPQSKLWYFARRKASRVLVDSILPSSIASEVRTGIVPGSIITGVQFGEQNYRVERLSDVKDALAEALAEKRKAVRLVYLEPIVINEQGILSDPETGLPVYRQKPSFAIVPLDEVVTPSQLSVRKFAASFDFSGENPASQDWRRALRANCERILKSK